MVTPPTNAAARRWSGPLVVIVLLAAGIVFWIIMAQAQRDALARLKSDLTKAREQVAELALDNERLQREVGALTEALQRLDTEE